MENVGPYSTIREEASVIPEQFFQLSGEAAGISHKRDADAAVSWIEGETDPFDPAVGLISFENCCTLCHLEPSIIRRFFRQNAQRVVVADPEAYGDFVNLANVKERLDL